MSIESRLTGIKDTDLEILSNLEPREVIKFCAVDRYSNSICKHDRVWSGFIGKCYGHEMVNYAHKEEKTFFEFYWHLDKLFKGKCGERLYRTQKIAGNSAYIAGRHGYLPILQFIFENVELERKQIALIHMAVTAGRHIEVIEFLLDEGFITVENLEGSLLHDNMNLEMAKFLLELGIDIHHADDNALNTAASEKNVPLTALYLEYGADPMVIERANRRWISQTFG